MNDSEKVGKVIRKAAESLPTAAELNPKLNTCTSLDEDESEDVAIKKQLETRVEEELDPWADFPDITGSDDDEEDEGEVGNIYIGKPDPRVPIKINGYCKGSIYTIEAENTKKELDMYLIDHTNQRLMDCLTKAEDSSFKKRFCIQCVTRNGQNFFWQVPEVTTECIYKGNAWWTSALTIMRDFGKSNKWFKVSSKSQGDKGKYIGKIVGGQDDKPQFIDGDFNKLIKVAFGDNFISDIEHPVIQENYYVGG